MLDAIGLSALNVVKPSQPQIEALAAGKFADRRVNHAHGGASASAPDLPPGVAGGGFRVVTGRRKVGQGQQAYDAAVAALKRFDQLQLGWNFTTRPAASAGAALCSATQTFVPWFVLPAQVQYANEEPRARLADGGEGEGFLRRYLTAPKRLPLLGGRGCSGGDTWGEKETRRTLCTHM